MFENTKSKNGQSPLFVTDEILIAEAKRLQECIQSSIDEYYSWYEPVQYKRTYGLKNALQVQTAVQNDGSNKYIGLYFDDSKSWGQSVVTGSWDGYKPWLMNDGWKNREYNLPDFFGFEGFHFIEKGIADWKDGLKYPIDVKRIGATGKFDVARAIGYAIE